MSRSTRCGLCHLLIVLSLFAAFANVAQADIITSLTGRIGLAPVYLEIDTVHAATNVNGVVHVVGQHNGRAARQLVDLATGIASPVELFDSLSSAQGFGGNTDGKIKNVTLLNDGRTLYVGQSYGTGSNEPTFWFSPDAPRHPLTQGQSFSGEIAAVAGDGTFVGTSGFTAAVYGSVDSNSFQVLPGFAPNRALDITYDGRYIAGGNYLWTLNDFGGYNVLQTSSFDFSITGGDSAGWIGAAIDPIVGDAVFAGSFFDLDYFGSRVGFWRADGSLIGATSGLASFADFQVVDGQLVAAVNGLDDGYLFAMTDFSSISMSSLLGESMRIDALYSGSLGFVGQSGSGGMFIGTTTAAVPEPSSLVMLGTATLGMLLYNRRKRRKSSSHVV